MNQPTKAELRAEIIKLRQELTAWQYTGQQLQQAFNIQVIEPTKRTRIKLDAAENDEHWYAPELREPYAYRYAACHMLLDMLGSEFSKHGMIDYMARHNLSPKPNESLDLTYFIPKKAAGE